MAKVTARCEFMDNAFPAGKLSLKGDFSVVEDTDGEHMIFSVDKKDKLCLIMKGDYGQNDLIDLNARFGLPENATVSSFAVSQNNDKKIHLVFAVRQASGFDALHVVRPMSTKREEWLSPATIDVYSGAQSEINVRQIMLGTSNDSSNDAPEYPQVYLVFNKKNKTTEDFCALTVDVQERTWKNPNILQMPCNPDQIIDKCPGNLKLYRGMFVLYRENSPTPLQLRFVGYNPTKTNPTLQSIVQQVPEGTKAIAALENSAGYTDLLIAGKNLMWRSAQDCFKGTRASPLVLNDDSLLSEPRQFLAAQSDDAVSIWSLNKDSLLGYQEFDLRKNDSPTARTPAIPLLEGRNDRFAALQHPMHGQKLFVMDMNNDLKMLEQSNDTGLWQSRIDIMIPDSGQMTVFKSHTLRIQLNDASKIALPSKKLRLCCSTSAELLVNGVSVRGSPEGQIVATDDSGTLTVIIKSDGMSAPLITLKDPDSTSQVFTNPVTIDPMEKFWSTVDDLDSGDKLRSARLNDGTPFLNPGADSDDVDTTAKALCDLRTARQDIQNPGSISVPAPKAPPRKKSGGVWGAFFWVRSKIREGINFVKEGLSWIVEKAGGIWKFKIMLAGMIWEFVCENLPQVAEATQAVLSVVGKGLQWIAEKVLVSLGWDDILDTKNMLVNLTNQGLLWGVDALAMLEMKVDEFFDDLREKVQSLKGIQPPKELANIKLGGNPDPKSNTTEEEVLNSPIAQYGYYHLKHSGNSLDARNEDETAADRLLKRLGNVGAKLEELVSRLGDNVAAILKTQDFDFQTILTQLGVDLLDDALAVFQTIVVSILGTLGDLIVDLVDGLNESISIPVLSPLYRNLTKNELTVLDLVCLCIAIPITILFKAVSGKRPRDLDDTGMLIKHDAMREELDQRMGRVRRESKPFEARPVQAQQELKPQFEERRINAPQELKPQLFAQSAISTPITNSSSTLLREPAQSRATANTASKETTIEKRYAIEGNRKRFMKSSHQLSSLLKGGVPVAKYLWYQFYSWPKLFEKEDTLSWKKAISSAGAKLVFLLISFPSVASWSKEDILEGNFDLIEKSKDPWFSSRYMIWMLGAVNIFGALTPKALKHGIGFTVTIIQASMLLLLHITSYTEGAGYSYYLLIEEWTKIRSRLATHWAGFDNGADGYTGPIALVLTLIGASMNMVRCGLEFNGKRGIVATGVDLE